MKTVAGIGSLAGAAVAAAALLFATGILPPSIPPAEAQRGPGAGQILLAAGPGLVLTRDGMLWQYRPDQGKWQTVDEGFAEQGKTTHVIPLPVPPESIAQMETFGFLVTNQGECWLYDYDGNQWRSVGSPPRR
ncbi:MAG: hypothetical protein ACE15D_16160 [Candidatus Eisenbacteria bacterium]|nr:hypothetical protein [Candidatus Eisenbacteria bacterium]